MTDYNTMTTQQCSDWLAEREQFEPSQCGLWRSKITGIIVAHPFPLTLDAAAAALRNPWRLAKVCCIDGMYNCTVWKNAGSICTIVDAPDELTARYRAAVAARMEDDK